MIEFSSKGNFDKTESFLKRTFSSDIRRELEKYGQMGVTALANATPVDSGKTAASWTYKVIWSGRSASIQWSNSNVESGNTPVAILLQYGHGTGTGGYVAGRDYINPAIKPVFDKIADGVWKAVTK